MKRIYIKENLSIENLEKLAVFIFIGTIVGAMNTNNLKLIFLFLIIMALASCEYAYDYTYQVTNNNESEVKIELKTFRIDSVFTIEANETKILFITDHGVEGSKGPYFDNVTIDLDKFIVTKNDTLVSSKNYLDNSSWNFDNGLYSTTINNDEFQ
ncbi:MAG: hypothetical protein PHP53_18760 [Prolixibacteraceae bacterium]|nr:hypothetical protein [Prolixibacteraceae bacterium]